MYAQLSTAEQYSFSVELPAHLDDAEKNRLDHQINAGLEGIRQENHALLVNLVAQLVLAQVRLEPFQRRRFRLNHKAADMSSHAQALPL